jgi:hypothetical protein
MDSHLLSSCAVMQPYFLPYIGYFQLINAVDTFVLYDDIEYTKKGWINRNRFNVNGVPTFITVPLKKDSDYLEVRQRLLSPDFVPKKLLNVFDSGYRRAKFYDETRQVVESILQHEDRNLFGYIHNSIKVMCKHMDIETPIVVSSDVLPRGNQRGVDRVIGLCKRTDSCVYVNPPGGRSLYSAACFQECGMSLRFLCPNLTPYNQLSEEFLPALSIIDVLANCGKAAVVSAVKLDFEIECVDSI